MKIKSTLAAFVLCLAAFAAPAAADDIVNTGPGGSTAEYLLGYGGYGYSQNLAAQFSLGQSTTLTDIDGWIDPIFDSSLLVRIYGDGGLIPDGGQLLYSEGFDVSQGSPAWLGVHGLNWTLGAGTYWVSFEGLPGSWTGMSSPSGAPLGQEAFTSVGDGQWYTYDGLDIGVHIQGKPVPEPGTMVLLAAGGAGLFAARKRRKMAV